MRIGSKMKFTAFAASEIINGVFVSKYPCEAVIEQEVGEQHTKIKIKQKNIQLEVISTGTKYHPLHVSTATVSKPQPIES